MNSNGGVAYPNRGFCPDTGTIGTDGDSVEQSGVAMGSEATRIPATRSAVAMQRLEDLEEALRRIVIVLQPDGQHPVTDRDLAALAIACDVLDLDFPEFDWLTALA
jgi:hypothetical protein